jgi:hypothetical protein
MPREIRWERDLHFKITMSMKTRIHAFLLVCLWLAPYPALADPMPIGIVSTRYKTFVETTHALDPDLSEVVVTARSQDSTTAISDSLRVNDAEWARVHSDLFSISTYTEAKDPVTRFAYSKASAESVTEFLSLQSGTVLLNVDLTAEDYAILFSQGAVTLVDVTAGLMLWDYWWDTRNANFGNVPWIAQGTCCSLWTAGLDLETPLSASHLYSLRIFGGTDSSIPDLETLTISVSGLQPVPEPSTLFLVGSAAAIGVWRRRCRRARINS